LEYDGARLTKPVWRRKHCSGSSHRKEGSMQPRGQLWFALEALCRDFRTCSGLEEKAALQVLIVVLTNMLAEQQAALEALNSANPSGPPGEASATNP